jgi:hypothetical protein
MTILWEKSRLMTKKTRRELWDPTQAQERA